MREILRRQGLSHSKKCTENPIGSFFATDITSNKKEPVLDPSMTILKSGHIFEINRPNFKSETHTIQGVVSDFDISTLNKRVGLGNNVILRENFLQPDVAPRQAVDFELIERTRVQQEGIQVRLGDKTLKDLFKVVTVDPSDKEWLDEYKRLQEVEGKTKEQLDISPPFGRPQRPLTKMVNFGQAVTNSALDITEKLDLLNESVKSNGSNVDQAGVLAELMKMLDDVNNYTKANNNLFKGILNNLNVIPRDAKEYFGSGYHRFWSNEQVLSILGRITLFILSKNITGDIDSPVYGTGRSKVPIKINSMLTYLQKTFPLYNDQGQELKLEANEVYLDIEELSLKNYNEVVKMLNIGVDEGKLNGQLPPPSSIQGEPSVWLTTQEMNKASGTRSPPVRLGPVTPVPSKTSKTGKTGKKP